MTAYEMRISDWSSDVCSSDLLAHALCKQDLADAVVDLVRAGVVQVLALQIDFCPAQRFGQARREIERAFAADEMLEQIVDFRLERRVGGGGAIFPLKVQDQRHQRFRDIAAAELAEVAALVRHGPETVGLGAHALLTAFKNASIFARDFTPGLSSTPDDTSTRPVAVTPIASRTLAASSPPDTPQRSGAR